MIKLKNLKFSYNGVSTLNKVSVEIEAEKLTVILGPNGAGKTTLLKCIDGILKPKEGVIYIDKIDIKNLKPPEIAKLVGYVPQKSSPLLISVFDYVLLGRIPHMGFGMKKEDLKIVEDTLRELGIEKLALKKLNQLSGGELQKVVIARALVQKAKVLLLDEPINNLDLKSQFELMKLVKKLTHENKMTTVMVVHDINMALRFADRFIFMKNGKVMAQGGREIVTSKLIQDIYDIHVIIEKLSDVLVVVPV